MEKYVKIAASAAYLPPRVVTNDELSQIMPTSDEWIQAHTGIKTRHFALEENTSMMGAKVAQQLLEQAQVAATDIDLIIVATISPDAITPATATLIQKAIGATKAFAYDISAACAGFIFALSTADKFLRTAQYHRALVISAENFSKMLDFQDRTSAVFFGDGAAGVLLESSTDPADNMIIAESLHADGNAEVIHSGRITPITDIAATNYPQMDAFFQDGRAVYQFVTENIPPHIREFCDHNGLTPDDLDMVITHQANLRLIEKIAALLQQPMSKFPHNVDRVGNTSSAGIALVLNEILQAGKRPQKLMLTGFGAGLAYGSILLDLQHYQ